MAKKIISRRDAFDTKSKTSLIKADQKKTKSNSAADNESKIINKTKKGSGVTEKAKTKDTDNLIPNTKSTVNKVVTIGMPVSSEEFKKMKKKAELPEKKNK